MHTPRSAYTSPAAPPSPAASSVERAAAEERTSSAASGGGGGERAAVAMSQGMRSDPATANVTLRSGAGASALPSEW